MDQTEAAALLQKNAGYYLEKWDKYSHSIFKGWNWSAMFLCETWMLYRKMYLEGVLFFALRMSLSFVLGILIPFLPAFLISNYLVPWAFVGIFGNALYRRKVLRMIQKAQELNESERLEFLRNSGGTSIAATYIIPILLLLLTLGQCAFRAVSSDVVNHADINWSDRTVEYTVVHDLEGLNLVDHDLTGSTRMTTAILQNVYVITVMDIGSGLHVEPFHVSGTVGSVSMSYRPGGGSAVERVQGRMENFILFPLNLQRRMRGIDQRTRAAIGPLRVSADDDMALLVAVEEFNRPLTGMDTRINILMAGVVFLELSFMLDQFSDECRDFLLEFSQHIGVDLLDAVAEVLGQSP